MKITFDQTSDTLTIVFKYDAVVQESDEGKPDAIMDYDANGDLVSLEVLDASHRITNAGKIEFEAIPANLG